MENVIGEQDLGLQQLACVADANCRRLLTVIYG